MEQNARGTKEKLKIDVFDYIETAISELDKHRAVFETAARQIAEVLKGVLAPLAEDVLDVTYRVKGDDSLREKILRKGLYRECPPERLAYEAHDIIGLRIECRFLADEGKIYEALRAAYTETQDGEFYRRPGCPRMCLRLSGAQPEVQQNGFEIYRIDGKIAENGFSCNFELQIKSLVNAFWSEIEHKIVYKNKRFMMIDSFVTEQMAALNKNLYLIDRQLNMLYNRCLDRTSSVRQKQLEALLVMFINELFSRIVKAELGFEVNIKSLSESIVEYIFHGSSFSYDGPVPEGGAELAYGNTLLMTLRWIKNVDFTAVHIGEAIALPARPAFANPAEQRISEAFLREMNEDFFANLFFHMLFSLETGNDLADYTDFVHYYRVRTVPETFSREQLPRLEAFLKSRTFCGLVSPEGMAELRAELGGCERNC